MSMVDGIYTKNLPALVEDGRLGMAVVDEAVRRVLRAKVRAGLFEDPYRYNDPAREAAMLGAPAHRALRPRGGAAGHRPAQKRAGEGRAPALRRPRHARRDRRARRRLALGARVVGGGRAEGGDDPDPRRPPRRVPRDGHPLRAGLSRGARPVLRHRRRDAERGHVRARRSGAARRRRRRRRARPRRAPRADGRGREPERHRAAGGAAASSPAACSRRPATNPSSSC